MRTKVSSEKLRFNLRIHRDIKAGLQELQKRRGRAYNNDSLADLMCEGALLLLEKEGVPVNGAQREAREEEAQNAG